MGSDGMAEDHMSLSGRADGGFSYLSARFLPNSRTRGVVSGGVDFGKNGKASPVQILAVCLRVVGTFFTYSTVLSYGLPPFVHAFYLHTAAAVCHIVGRRFVWSNNVRKQLLLLVMHAGWQAINFIMWITALLMLHPMQAVLAEYGEHLFLALITENLNRTSGSVAMRRRGVVLKFIASMLLIAVAHGWYEIPDAQPAPQKFHPQSNTWGGIALMVLYTFSEVMRKSYKSFLAKSVGMPTVTVVSGVLIPVMLLPFIVLYSGFAPHAWSIVQSPYHIFSLFVNALLLLVVPAFIIPVAAARDGEISPLTSSVYMGGVASRIQCCMTMGAAFLVHFWMVYNPDNTGFGLRYMGVLGLSFACMLSALTGSHQMITRSSQPFSMDPFAEYALPDIEEMEGGMLNTILKSKTSRRLLVFLLLNVFYMCIEFLYGAFSGSLGLISDSFHMMLDSISVAIALVASYVATWPSNNEHTFGYGRYEVMSGFTNGVILICIAVYIFMQAVMRIAYPREVGGDWLLSVSLGGLFINVIGVVFFHEAHHVGGGGGSCGGHGHGHAEEPKAEGHGHGHSHSHGHSHGGGGASATSANMRGVYLHILADLLGSVGVIVSSCIVRFTGWSIADPICSICIAILILLSALPLLQDTGVVLLQSLTETQDSLMAQCIASAEMLPNVKEVKTKFWQHTPGSPMGFVYITMSDGDELKILSQAKQIFSALGSTSTITIEIRKPVG